MIFQEIMIFFIHVGGCGGISSNLFFIVIVMKCGYAIFYLNLQSITDVCFKVSLFIPFNMDE